MIRIKPNCSNKGKESQYVKIKAKGVPVTGLIDNGSDITIMRDDLFYVGKVGIEADQLQSPAHMACTYVRPEAHYIRWTDGDDTKLW